MWLLYLLFIILILVVLEMYLDAFKNIDERLRRPLLGFCLWAAFTFVLYGHLKSAGEEITGLLAFSSIESACALLSVYALALNSWALLKRRRPGQIRQLLEAEADARYIGYPVKSQNATLPLSVEKRKVDMRWAAFGSLAGFGVFANFALLVPGLRSILSDSFTTLLPDAAVFIISGACGGLLLRKNRQWIEVLGARKKEEERAARPVQLPDMAAQRELALLLGEEHRQHGERVSDPRWSYLEGKGLYAGILSVGDLGSGKTTCVGLPWLHTMLAHGLGGLVLDAGGNYTKFIERLMQKLGREKDLIVIRPNGPWKYNAVHKPDMTSADLAGWMFMVMRNLANANTVSANDAFWEVKGREYANAVIDLCRLFDPGSITFEVLYRLNSDEQARNRILAELEQEIQKGTTEERYHTIQHQLAFWRKTLKEMAPNLRGSIPAQFDGVVSMFSSEYSLFRTFCPHPDEGPRFDGFTPEMLDASKVVLLDMPLRAYPHSGKVIATMLKLDFQRCVNTRTQGRSEEDVKQPVFLLIDEAQNYVSARGDLGDPMYLAESRKNKAINIYMSQSIDSFQDAFRDEKSCNVFFNNLRTKLLMSQEGSDSQKMCADFCGKATQFKKTITEAEAGRRTDLNYLAGGLLHEEMAVTKTVAYAEHDEYIFKLVEFRNLPPFVAIVNQFTGDKKLPPRVVYMKPMFVDGSGEICHHERASWFSGEKDHLRSYQELMSAEVRS